jgi:6,7-dimethyl-8-ribityllumazine synthase
MSQHRPASTAVQLPPGTRVAIVAARFNETIVDRLLDGCVARLRALGLGERGLCVERVPGAFELPLAAKWLAETGDFAAVICLGCVIRGETAHFEHVATQAASGILQTALTSGFPVIFGVLTTETEQQAMDRSGGEHSHAGESAADAAAEMIALRANVFGGRV